VLKEFRAFVLRGNVVDLAVAVVVGAAFGAVITSLVADVITPIISIPGDIPNFGALTWTVGEGEGAAVIAYGNFLNALVAFLTIAAAVFFFVVKPINRLMERFKTQPEVESETKKCPECLSDVPKDARRCAFCTSSL
jgi:large conductance mechanosensitive channel